MPPGHHKPDKAPLDPGGQALGQVTSLGTYMDHPARIILLASPKTTITAFQPGTSFLI
jgi:hypothetical protein